MKVFLSHSSADNKTSLKLFEWLQDKAVPVWFDNVELRPGDSLNESIMSGIESSDILLVIISKNSIKSSWVKKEIMLMIRKQISDGRTRVIPLIYGDVKMPHIISKIVHMNITNNKKSFEKIIPAIFHDSFILDVNLSKKDLSVDRKSLVMNLHHFHKSNFKNIYVRINNNDFNHKINLIVDKEIVRLEKDKPEYWQFILEQMSDGRDSHQIRLPLFWTNLTILLSKAIIFIKEKFERSVDFIETAKRTITKSLELFQFYMCQILQNTVFKYDANKYGFPEIALFLEKYEHYNKFNYDQISSDILEIGTDHSRLAHVDIIGNDKMKINTTSIYLDLSESSQMDLWLKLPISSFVSSYMWYAYCVPQILVRFARDVTWESGKSVNEIEYQMGFNFSDYVSVGPH